MTDEYRQASATFTIIGPPAQVSAFRRMLTAIDLMCQAGASRTIELLVDGDGATALSVLENGKHLSQDLSVEEEEFYIWPHMRASTLADAPPSIRDYSIGWRCPNDARVLRVELDGCGPPDEAG